MEPYDSSRGYLCTTLTFIYIFFFFVGDDSTGAYTQIVANGALPIEDVFFAVYVKASNHFIIDVDHLSFFLFFFLLV